MKGLVVIPNTNWDLEGCLEGTGLMIAQALQLDVYFLQTELLQGNFPVSQTHIDYF